MTIDATHLVYIQYQKLNDQSFIKEQQKDLISQVLSKNIFPHRSMIELDDSKNFEKRYWTITCQMCPGSQISARHGVQNLDTTKRSWKMRWETFSKKTTSQGLEISYKTKDTFEKMRNWKIIISPSKNYTIRKGEKVKIVYHATETLTLEGYGHALKNGRTGEKIDVKWDQKVFGNHRLKKSENIVATIERPGMVEYGNP